MSHRRKDIQAKTDEELVAALQRGDQEALGGLWDRYAHLLFGVAMKYLKDTDKAGDLVAQLFTELPELVARHSLRSFRPWVHTVARNACLQRLRSGKHDLRLGMGPEPAADDGEDRALHEYELQRLEQAIGHLKPEQRICITLFYLEKNSYSRVAEITGHSVDQVRSHIQNGRRNLRIILQAQ